MLPINAVNSISRYGTMGAIMAAKNYKVPPSTLKDRISRKVKHETPIPYLLTVGEEKELYDFLVQVAAMGCGKTKREVYVSLESDEVPAIAYAEVSRSLLKSVWERVLQQVVCCQYSCHQRRWLRCL